MKKYLPLQTLKNRENKEKRINESSRINTTTHYG
jgi:hypothetical protein